MKAFAVRKNSFESINHAGKQLVSLPRSDKARDAALDVVNNWRSCHAYPLQIIRKTLAQRAVSISSSEPLVAQRIKRLPSIILKLSENSMRLTQMQDIGGCRAVLEDVEAVDRLVEIYARGSNVQDSDKPVVVRKFDYISKPKLDGYRSVHLVIQFHGTTHPDYNGQKIEIQIRTRLQHAWATAVEICQTFTNQALKSKKKSGEAYWIKFFSWTSSAIAASERRPIVPGTTTDSVDRRRAIQFILHNKNIEESFAVWGEMLRLHENAADQNAEAYLLELSPPAGKLSITGFARSEMRDAQAMYLKRERETQYDIYSQVLLVSAGSLQNLKRAYPNYYLDSSEFVSAVKRLTLNTKLILIAISLFFLGSLLVQTLISEPPNFLVKPSSSCNAGA